MKLADQDAPPKKLKHVAIRLAYLQDLSDKKVVRIHHMSKDGMIADIGTKVLRGAAFWTMNNFLF